MDEEIIVKVEPIDLSDEETQQSENPNSGNEFDLFGICKVEKEEPLFDETPATAGDEAGTSPQPHSSTAPYSNNMIFLKEEGSDNFYPEDSYEEEADDFDSSNYASKGWGSHSELNHPGIKEDEEMNTSQQTGGLKDQEKIKTENSRLKFHSNLDGHVAFMRGGMNFVCPLCGHKCRAENDLKKHIAQVHESVGERSKFPCSECDYMTHVKKYLRRHVNRMHKKILFCAMCKYKCIGKGRLKLHMKIHEWKNKFACPLCTYQSKTLPHLKIHVSHVHVKSKLEELNLVCIICRYQSKDKRDLLRHLVQDHASFETEFKYSCSLCEYVTNSKSNCKKHFAAIHEQNFIFSCSLCDFKCNWETSIKRHAKVHEEKQTYFCPLCDYKVRNVNYLKRHVASAHVRDVTFDCSVCGHKCSSEGDLTSHILQVHTSIKEKSNYSCPLCDFKTDVKSSLRKHITSVHGNKFSTSCSNCQDKHPRKPDVKNKFLCPLCRYKTITLNHLKIHVAYKHVKKLNLSCSICDYKCSLDNDLVMHIVLVHKSDNICLKCDYDVEFSSSTTPAQGKT